MFAVWDRYFTAGNDSICCSKCLMLLKARVNEAMGDNVRYIINSITIKTTDLSSRARGSYTFAIDYLSGEEWKNGVSTVDMEVSAKHPMFCSALPMVDHIADKAKCWHGLPSQVMKSLLLTTIIEMKWECIRRRHLLSSLTKMGELFLAGDEILEARDKLLKGISVLVSRSTFHAESPVSFQLLAELIDKNIVGDMFAVEHAWILSHICWIALKNICTRTRKDKNEDLTMSFLKVPTIVSGLKLCFILSREVPQLFQLVSRVLCVLYTLSPSNETLSATSSGGLVSVSQWASYFHQASVGSSLQKTMDADVCCCSSSTLLSLHRLAPESVVDLKEYILKFFQGLPPSMLGGGLASFLRQFFPYDAPTKAWIMLSRLCSDDSIPVVVALAVDSISAVTPKQEETQWPCYWDHNIIDKVAPEFRSIMYANHASSRQSLVGRFSKSG